MGGSATFPPSRPSYLTRAISGDFGDYVPRLAFRRRLSKMGKICARDRHILAYFPNYAIKRLPINTMEVSRKWGRAPACAALPPYRNTGYLGGSGPIYASITSAPKMGKILASVRPNADIRRLHNY